MEVQKPDTGKPRRHGCLTAFLVVMITSFGLSFVQSALDFSFKTWAVMRYKPPTGPGHDLLFGLLELSCLVSSIALLKWKRWGFYGFVGTIIAFLGVNLSTGRNPAGLLLGVVFVGVLYWTLQMGGDAKAWVHLD